MDSRHWLAVLVGMILAGVALATLPAPQTLGTFQAWEASSYTDGDKKTCYVVSSPTGTMPKNVRRGEAYVMVSRRAQRKQDEITIVAGYPYKDESSVRISVGTSTLVLATADQFAWSPDVATSGQVVKAMISGQEMAVRGVSARGTKTTDTYSLLGFTAAYNAMANACR